MPKQITRVKWSARNIPYGVAFDENTGTFSGSPVNAGDYSVPVTVQTNYGSDTKDVALNIEDLKGVWIQTPRNLISSNVDFRSIKFAFDMEENIMFLGSGTASGKTNTFSVHYNPSNKTFSEVETLSGISNWAADIDPVTKKWLYLGTGQKVMTSSGIKEFGQNISMASAHCCWSPVLKKFCIVKSANKTGGGTIYNGSLIFDVDGNLLDFVNENNISSFASYYGGNALTTNTFEGQPLCWASGSINKFVNATYRTTPTIALSSDGLNWDLAVIDTSISGRIYCMSWLPEHNMLPAVKYNTSTKQNYIYTSNDGYNWTNIATLKPAVYSGSDNFILHTGAWSPSKKVFCLCGTGSSFITRDFITWEEMPYPLINANGRVQGSLENSHVMWSNIANAFILTTYGYGFLTLKV